MQKERLLDTFLDLVRHDNPSGNEAGVVGYIRHICESLGLETEQDNTYNLLVRLPGQGEPILLNAHTDSVRPCEGVRPIVADGVVRSSGDTVLGADDLAGVAAILEGLRTMHETGAPHRAADVLFTAQEEVGLAGAASFDFSRLRAREGFTLDAQGAIGGICMGGPSRDGFNAVVLGKAAHAGIAPEEGISAIKVAAEGIAAMVLGRLDDDTTANIGIINGGEAVNIVPPRVELRGEIRSHKPQKLVVQGEAMASALRESATRYGAEVQVSQTNSYHAYRLEANEPVVQQAQAALRAIGVEPYTFIGDGGSDVSVFGQHGLRVANLSIAYREIHTVQEHIAIADLEQVAELVTVLLKS